LVVEDNDGLRNLVAEVFNSAGHTTDTAASASAARHELLTKSYDVVVLDLYLGDESGLSIANLVAYSNPDCQIVLVTGSGMFAKGEIFEIAPSVSKILRKPVRVEELLAVSEHVAQVA
jgi:DNA-binding response OmpR family regulator